MKAATRESGNRYSSAYATERGWGGVVASETGLLEIVLPFGGLEREEIQAELARRWPTAVAESALTRSAAELLARYCSGERVTFDLPVDEGRFTPFQREVYRVVRGIGYGETLSYAGVAALAGSPGAARGVGSAMAHNPLPVVIPCHRVVAANGAMTGYSAPGGIGSKLQLLAMEGVRLTSSGKVERE